MDQYQAVVYRPGQPIDPRRPLQIENLPRDKWGPIAAAYPEIAFILEMGIDTRFFGTRNTTIFPPSQVSLKQLQSIGAWQDSTHHVYAHVARERLLAVVAHTVGQGGGYDSIHIYRRYFRPKRRILRRPM